MKRLMERAVALLGGAAMVVSSFGCYGYRNLVDPCYPERYTDASNKEVNACFAPQVLNGEVLDQTIWAHYFEPGTDKLTGGGLEQLEYIARRRPAPDPHVYLQAASVAEVGGYDPAKVDVLVQARNDLDGKRVQAIQKFLMALTAGRGIEFRITIHDPAEVGLTAAGVNNAVKAMQGRFQGGLQGGAGASTTGGGGASATGSAGSGSATPH